MPETSQARDQNRTNNDKGISPKMACSEHDSLLTEQYVTLSRTCPRRLADPSISNDAADSATPERTEAEWSLRRIEARIGSVA